MTSWIYKDRPDGRVNYFRSAILLFCTLCGVRSQAAANRINLHDGWWLQLSCKVSDRGGAISSAQYKPEQW